MKFFGKTWVAITLTALMIVAALVITGVQNHKAKEEAAQQAALQQQEPEEEKSGPLRTILIIAAVVAGISLLSGGSNRSYRSKNGYSASGYSSRTFSGGHGGRRPPK